LRERPARGRGEEKGRRGAAKHCATTSVGGPRKARALTTERRAEGKTKQSSPPRTPEGVEGGKEGRGEKHGGGPGGRRQSRLAQPQRSTPPQVQSAKKRGRPLSPQRNHRAARGHSRPQSRVPCRVAGRRVVKPRGANVVRHSPLSESDRCGLLHDIPVWVSRGFLQDGPFGEKGRTEARMSLYEPAIYTSARYQRPTDTR
jgi:hypothetical protein